MEVGIGMSKSCSFSFIINHLMMNNCVLFSQCMVSEMSASVETMLEKWKLHDGEEIDVFKEFGLLTTEVIARTAFGSSYMEGKHIFEMVAKLTAITVRNVYKVKFPGIR